MWGVELSAERIEAGDWLGGHDSIPGEGVGAWTRLVAIKMERRGQFLDLLWRQSQQNLLMD